MADNEMLPTRTNHCECGCGLLAPIATVTSKRNGHVRGEPMRFILGHAAKKSLADVFWKYIRIPYKHNDCWLWTGTLVSGYGQVNYQNKRWPAHRLSYMVHYGEFDATLFVCHHCDNKPCVNPAHLFLGTPKDNAVDAQRKGLLRKGAAVNTAKLHEHDVINIRRLFSRGYDELSLASRYGISRSNINMIIRGETWKHIGGPIKR